MAKKPSPFTHVNEIYKKNGRLENEDGYAQYIINKELSKNVQLVNFVNTVQKYKLENKHHFKVVNSIFPFSNRPGFKQFPWIWKGKQKPDPEVELVARYYEESISHAKEYVEILKKTKEGKEFLKWLNKVYGVDNS